MKKIITLPATNGRKIIERSEFEEQRDIFQRAHLHRQRYPQLRKMFAIPNGELRPQRHRIGKNGKLYSYSPVGRKLQQQGVKAGVLDICLPVARRGYFGLFIEMKSATGRLQENQRTWKGWLEEEGYHVNVCHSADEAWKVLVWYVTGAPTQIMRTETGTRDKETSC